ncbi:LuxR C-terminal-related transcriptional regulator [Nonomuraea sp. CA-141351]|uniref:helix-turn-helix transcriptional regulator n=1 Tax=Nonomuraea sp. CA-141351 TaxID=3239996 RepID=UPI003D940D8F
MPGTEEIALSIYRMLSVQGAMAVEEFAELAGLDEEQAARGLRRLRELGLVHEDNVQIEPVALDNAVARTMDAYDAILAEQAGAAAVMQQLTHSLRTVYQPAVAREKSRVRVESHAGRRTIERTLRDLGTAVKKTSEALHSGPIPPKDVLKSSLAHDARMIRRGVGLRHLYPRDIMRSPEHARYLKDLTEPGANVRLIDHAPGNMLIFDRLVTVIPCDPHNPNESLVVINGSVLTEAYMAVFEDYWLRSVSYKQAVSESRPAELSPQENTILSLHSGGLSDDQIARKVGVHRRTVQRAVTKLMDRLGASNRFQAGLKLARCNRTTRVVPGPESLTSRSAGPGVLHVGSGEAMESRPFPRR